MTLCLWMVRTLLCACRVRRALENTCKPVSDGPDAALTYGRGLLQVPCLNVILRREPYCGTEATYACDFMVSIESALRTPAMLCRSTGQ